MANSDLLVAAVRWLAREERGTAVAHPHSRAADDPADGRAKPVAFRLHRHPAAADRDRDRRPRLVAAAMSAVALRRLALPLLALLALAYLAAMVVSGAQPVQRQLVKFEAKGVLQIEPEAVQKITLGRGGRQLVLVRSGEAAGRWSPAARSRGLRRPISIPRSRCCTVRRRCARSPRRSCRASTRVRSASKSRWSWRRSRDLAARCLTRALRRPQSGGLPAIHADRRRSQGLPDVALHRRRMDGGVGRPEGAMTWARALAVGRGRFARFRRRRRAPGRDHRPRHGFGRRAVRALRALLAGRRVGRRHARPA